MISILDFGMRIAECGIGEFRDWDLSTLGTLAHFH